jgi:hypothetical protein
MAPEKKPPRIATLLALIEASFMPISIRVQFWRFDTAETQTQVMDKEFILGEIRRTAAANAGKALGVRRFEAETGIGQHDWYGRYWARWSEALREAGFQPNRMSEAFADVLLVETLVMLTRRLGRVPIQADVMLASNNDASMPSEKVFRRLGPKGQPGFKGYCLLRIQSWL